MRILGLLWTLVPIINWIRGVKSYPTTDTELKKRKELLAALIREESEELIKAINENDTKGIYDAIVDSLWVNLNVFNTFEDLDVNLLANAFREVEKSNYSKFAKDEYRFNSEDHKYTIVRRKVGKSYIYVLQDDNGKIRKPHFFTLPSIDIHTTAKSIKNTILKKYKVDAEVIMYDTENKIGILKRENIGYQLFTKPKYTIELTSFYYTCLDEAIQGMNKYLLKGFDMDFNNNLL